MLGAWIGKIYEVSVEWGQKRGCYRSSISEHAIKGCVYREVGYKWVIGTSEDSYVN